MCFCFCFSFVSLRFDFCFPFFSKQFFFLLFWLILCCDFWLHFSAFNLFINWILTNELKRFRGASPRGLFIVCVCVLWKRQSKENIIVKIHERGRQGRRLCAVCVRSTESEIVEATLLYSTEHTVWELTECEVCGELWKQFINRKAWNTLQLDQINNSFFFLFVYVAVGKAL